VVRLLGLEAGGPVVWDPDDRMRLLVAESPEEMEEFLEARRSHGYGARAARARAWLAVLPDRVGTTAARAALVKERDPFADRL
jgi:hypothetical protein